MVYANVFQTPVGPMLSVVDSAGALVRLDFLCGREPEALVQADASLKGIQRLWDQPERAVDVREQLTEYFAGVRERFSLALKPTGTVFRLQVWAELERIPYGTTCSYSEVARRLGTPLASRAVGAANGANPLSVVVPCHRVIGADGSLTGYGSGIPLKKRLLALERERLLTTGGLPPVPQALFAF